MSGLPDRGTQGRDVVTHEVGPGESASTAVVRAVAAADGREPAGDVDGDGRRTPLYDVVDPDALDAVHRSLTARESATGRISFRYCGYGVTVTLDAVRVEP